MIGFSPTNGRYAKRTSCDSIPIVIFRINSFKAFFLFLLYISANIQTSLSEETSPYTKAVLAKSRKLEDEFRASDIKICNKPTRASALRSKAGEMQSFATSSTSLAFKECTEDVIAMRNAYIAKQNKRFALFKSDHTAPFAKGCDGKAVRGFYHRLLQLKTSNALVAERKIVHCQELTDKVILQFMESTDPDLEGVMLSTISLENPATGENHIFALVLPKDTSLNEGLYTTSIDELVGLHPSARVIDLWNHLSFPLHYFNDTKKFKKAVSKSFQHVLSDDTRPLPKDHTSVTSSAEAYSESVRRYYTGFSQCTLEVLPKKPTESCALDLLRYMI